MFVTGGYYTRKVAAEAGATLKYLFEHPEDKRYFQLELVPQPPHEGPDFTVNFRLIDDLTARVITLANGREIVRCVTDAGHRLDIVFGHEAERELEPALVLIEEA